jgi:hypothetical protein
VSWPRWWIESKKKPQTNCPTASSQGGIPSITKRPFFSQPAASSFSRRSSTAAEFRSKAPTMSSSRAGGGDSFHAMVPLSRSSTSAPSEDARSQASSPAVRLLGCGL